MEQTSWWKHRAFDQTEIGGNIVKVFSDDVWMAHNRSGHFIAPWIKAREVHVPKHKIIVTHGVKQNLFI
jgi:hypothetical protein